MLKTHPFNGATLIRAHGRMLHYARSSADTSGLSPLIVVWVDGRELCEMAPGGSVVLDDPVDSWEIRPQAPTLTGAVTIGNGQVLSPQIAGLVQVVDNSVAATLAGEEFWCAMSRTAAAAQFAAVGVSNPITSGQRAVIDAATVIASGVAGNFRVFQATGHGTAPLGARQAKNKILNNAPGGSQFRLHSYDSTSATAPSFAPAELTNWVDMGQGRVAANGQMDLIRSKPWVIDPGFGMWVVFGAAAAEITLHIEAREQPV